MLVVRTIFPDILKICSRSSQSSSGLNSMPSVAASMLATTLGIEFNPELDWDEREQIFKMSGKIVRTTNITQSAIGNKDGLWTTVFAACVFINDDNSDVKPDGKSEARADAKTDGKSDGK